MKRAVKKMKVPTSPSPSQSPSPTPDPVVAEVRAIRARLWKEGGGTAAGYLKLMRETASPLPTGRAKATRTVKTTSRGRKSA